MVEESGYPTPHRLPSVTAPASPARLARRFGTAIADARVQPRDHRSGTGIGVVITSDRQLRVVRTARPRGLRLEGEVDLANVEIVRHSLRAVARDGADIIVDVSRLAFIDVAGLRVVVEGANEVARRGGRLVLVGASRQLVRILRLCGWDAATGLHIGRPGPH
ncbi:STAS domain-containing protein [Yinghuangia seranimata]|uniref:STAS domain-containing protein n=1 Tax=Yinghuangia seranimata TaxID=408067 RepID=UPI00248D27A3|nr:STAS domain-containing protein [Yinghuangia seranimata]MDI2132766.1 STAS domain-containing protein [Yinghuangia seranimata]